jgi:hypothetical protein
MSNVLSVNELIDRASELDGQPVDVAGILTLEFEDCSLGHFPKVERREITETIDTPHYPSSVWITFGTGSIQPDEDVLARWTRKRVRVVGIVHVPEDGAGCGHFGRWACEVGAYAVERI